jgi:acetolactate synthase-1/2/3 large subunit
MLGVVDFFGVSGGPIACFFRAIAEALRAGRDLRLAQMKDERAAGHSADFFHRVSGHMAAVVGTAGVALSNLRTALHTARADGSALFAVVGATPLRHARRRCAQQLDLEAELSPAVKARGRARGYAVLRDPRRGPALVRKLWRFALEGARGPVVLVIPLDVGNQRVPGGHRLLRAARAPRPAPPARRAIARATKILLRARRPVILAGYGAVSSGAAGALRTFVERTGYPVAFSARANGIMPSPEFHGRSLGVMGLGGRRAVAAAIAKADAILLVGEPLGDLTSNGFSSVFARKPIVQIDVAREAIGRAGYPIAVGVVADARLALEELTRSMAAAMKRLGVSTPLSLLPVPRPPRWPTVRELVGRSKGRRLTPRRALQLLARLIPSNTHILADIGRSAMCWSAHELRLLNPYHYHLPQQFGAMGSSVSGALGAALATRELVVVLTGDQGFHQTEAAELESARRAKARYIMVVLNDGGSGMVDEGHRRLPGRYPSVMDDHPCPVVEPIRARGFQAFGARTARGLIRAFARARTARGPAVIDVSIRFDPRDPTPMSGRVSSFK